MPPVPPGSYVYAQRFCDKNSAIRLALTLTTGQEFPLLGESKNVYTFEKCVHIRKMRTYSKNVYKISKFSKNAF